MIEYRPGDDVGPLQDWPFDNPASNYVIREGEPRASGRIDAGGPGYTSRAGIWRCTKGVFDCTEQGDELMTILSGRCRVIDLDSGSIAELVPGDSLFVRDESRVTWDVIEDVVKVFYGQKTDGY
ncbi:cupin domain-containing protein [uncultured Roseovarius sp.]|uniref:cupin domain-containing protein n=1 Tax=uncultured Roseovarius sp. TaxID=293344 RepID=UPI0026270537|nr:cupin domain-containing protein [uncultured Roseovarius sp.]